MGAYTFDARAHSSAAATRGAPTIARCVSLIESGAPKAVVVVDIPQAVRNRWLFPRRKK